MKKLLLLCFSLAALYAQQSAVTLTVPSPTPATGVTATVIGTQGANVFYYYVVATYTAGNAAAAPSFGVAVNNAPTTLSMSNYVLVSWQASAGATSYTVLKTTTPGLPASCASCALYTGSLTYFSDTGGAGSSYTVSTAPSGKATISLSTQNEAYPFLNYALSYLNAVPGVSFVPNATGTVTANDCVKFGTTFGTIIDAGSACGTGGGSVTSVSFTGGIVSVATPTTTPALTVAGTSGGIPYFSGAATWASSTALGAGQFVLGGGAGAAPTTSFSVVPVTNGGTGTGGTLTGLVRGNASAFTASELSGDAATSGSNAVTVTGLNGTSLASLASGLLFNTTATGVPSIATSTQILTAIGNIPVTSLNSGTGASSATFWRGDATWAAPFTLTTTGTSGAATFSAGTLNIPNYATGGGSFSSLTGGTNTTAAMLVGGGSSLTSSGGSIVATSLGGTFAGHFWLGNSTSAVAAFSAGLIGTSDTSVNWYGTTTGTATAYTVTTNPLATFYSTGLVVNFTPNIANSGAGPTLALTGLGAGKTITKCGTTALVANDLTTTAVAQVLYDGTEFQLLNPQAAACGASGSSGALTRISQVVTSGSATSITFSSIPGTYTSLILKFVGRSNQAGTATDILAVQCNGDTGNDYNSNFVYGLNSTVGANSLNPGAYMNMGDLPESGVTTGEAATVNIDVIGYAGTTFFKNFISTNALLQGGLGAHASTVEMHAGEWQSTSAITSLTLSLVSGSSFLDGTTATLYSVQ